jgi:choline dehydrogenase
MVKGSYDVVVVGGGSAGCIIAARLSERSDRRVLLLEAGPDVRDEASLPAALSVRPANAVWDPAFLWQYPETSMNPAVRGRVLGGSSSVNGCAFVRGVPEDYDSWGEPEWCFESVLPFFRRLESDQDFSGAWHGADGPIPVRRYPHDDWHPLQAALFGAAREQGFPEKSDINAPEGWGVGPLPRNDPDGLRISAALGYLAPARDRGNLTVSTDSQASRLLMSRDRAVGVAVVSKGRTEVVYGDEIVVCAGAIGSPMLLMQSGIGPAHLLEDAGIEVVHDLPGVGQNLRDHPVIWVAARSADAASKPSADEPQQVVVTYTAPGSRARCDMQMLAAPIWGEDGVAASSDFILITTLELPKSVGGITIEPRGQEFQPRLSFGFLQDPEDQRRLREAARLSMRLLESEPFQELVGSVMSPRAPDAESDADLDRWVRTVVRNGQHSTGTCRMGAPDDEMAVVGISGRVRGRQGLRVADLSIVPNNVRANTNATALMIGERVAALIEEGF